MRYYFLFLLLVVGCAEKIENSPTEPLHYRGGDDVGNGDYYLPFHLWSEKRDPAKQPRFYYLSYRRSSAC